MTCFPSATCKSSPARGHNEVMNCVFVTEVSLVLRSLLATARSIMQAVQKLQLEEYMQVNMQIRY
jgi:hypothetical protein